MGRTERTAASEKAVRPTTPHRIHVWDREKVSGSLVGTDQDCFNHSVIGILRGTSNESMNPKENKTRAGGSSMQDIEFLMAYARENYCK